MKLNQSNMKKGLRVVNGIGNQGEIVACSKQHGDKLGAVIVKWDNPNIGVGGYGPFIFDDHDNLEHRIVLTILPAQFQKPRAGKILREKHFFRGHRVVLRGRAGTIECVGSWFVYIVFDNGDDGLYIRKDGKLFYRQSALDNTPTTIAPFYLEK